MAELNNIKILIAEDEVLIAEDIKEICEEAGYEVKSVCYRGAEAIEALDNDEFDFAIFDINLEDELTGLDMAIHIKQKKIQLPYIFLTSYSDAATLNAAKEVHPMGYVVKPFKKEQLLSTIEISIANYFSFKYSSISPPETVEKKYSIHFTDREKEIIPFLCAGQTNEQIAKKIYLSINTVKFHIKSIYDKLQINTRSQLILAMMNNQG
jgi:DNA-binding NarL/FixJ family response regulator